MGYQRYKRYKKAMSRDITLAWVQFSSSDQAIKEIMSTRKDLKPVKIAVVGVGSVGSTTAYTLLLSGMAADIILIDINKTKLRENLWT